MVASKGSVLSLVTNSRIWHHIMAKEDPSSDHREKEVPSSGHREKRVQTVEAGKSESLHNGPAKTLDGKFAGDERNRNALEVENPEAHRNCSDAPQDTKDAVNEKDRKPSEEADCSDGKADKKDTKNDSGKMDWSKHLKTIRVLAPYLLSVDRKHAKLRLTGIGGCIALTRLLKVLEPALLGNVVDGLGDSKASLPWNSVWKYFVVKALVSVGGVERTQYNLWSAIESSIEAKVSKDSYSKYMDMSSDFHDSEDSQNVLNTVSQSYVVPFIIEYVMSEIIPVLIDFLIAGQIFYSVFNKYMAGALCLSIVLYLLLSERSIRKHYDYSEESFKRWEEERRILTDTTRLWSTVTYFNRIQYEKEHYASAVDLSRTNVASRKLMGLVESLLEQLVMFGGMAFCCCLAALEIKNSNRGVGDFVMMMAYWEQVTSPFEHFMGRIKMVTERLAEASQLVELLSMKPAVQDKPDAADFEFKKGLIECNGLKFSYDGKREILKDITLRAEPGQTVGFVGTTGEGKSTILKTIFRLHDTGEGSVKIDGQDVRDVKMASFRGHIGVVPQDAALFNVSILENLKYARFGASLEECQEVCKATALHDKILTFPEGYSTVVGERGVKLSGGELQRLAIARVMLKDPEIVLLDEATSSVDSETEARIQANLRRWTKRRTTLIVAHRLSTIQHAHIIYVVKHGQIVEGGTHEDLLNANGHYTRMWNLQIGLERVEEP